MEEIKIKRPPSVLITQILVLLLSIPWLLIAPFRLLPSEIQKYGILPSVIDFLIPLVIASIFIAAFWGMAVRKNFGRWIAVGILVLLLGVLIVGQFVRIPGPMQYYEYKNQTQVVAGIVTAVVMLGGFAFYIYRLAFGSAANAFFAKPTSGE